MGVEQEEPKPTSLAAALSMGMSTTSRFVGKMQNLQVKIINIYPNICYITQRGRGHGNSIKKGVA